MGLFKGNFIDFILNYPNNWMSTNELSNQTIRKIMNKNDNIYLSSDNEIFMLDQYSVFKSNFFLNEDIFFAEVSSSPIIIYPNFFNLTIVCAMLVACM